MRYTRLRRQIESGALNTGHGPGFSSAASPPPSSPNTQAQTALERTPISVPKKRKRGKKSQDAGMTAKAKTGGGDGPREAEAVGKSIKGGQTPADGMPSRQAYQTKQESKGNEEGRKESKIKIENYSGSDADFDSDTEDDEDSEDEIPLAKLRKRRAFGLSPSPSLSTALTPGHAQRLTPAIKAPMYSTYAASRSYGHKVPSAEVQVGHGHLMERPRYVPQGFNGLAIGSSNGRGNLYESSLYASPYAGWIECRAHGNQMGHPGPGWEYRARLPESQHLDQRQEIHNGKEIKDNTPRKSI